MVVSEASRGTDPSRHHGSRKRRSTKNRTPAKRFQSSPSAVALNPHHEHFSGQHPHGSRLIGQYHPKRQSYSSSSSDSIDSVNGDYSNHFLTKQPETVEIEIHHENSLGSCDDNHFSSDSAEYIQEELGDSELELQNQCTINVSKRKTSFRSTPQYHSTRIRKNSFRRSKRARAKSESLWADTDFVAVADTLLRERIQKINREQLVLDFSQTSTLYEEIEAEPSLDVEEKSYYQPKKVERGIPVEDFPQSLIQWPGNNSNKQKRLSEIKKQVKLLSNIIKMTIEGGQDQDGGRKDSVGGVPAPFTQYVDIKTLPSSALTNTNEDLFLPSIQDLMELLTVNKVKEAKSILRTAGGALTCPTRPTLWQELCKRQTTEQFSDSFYYDTIQQIYGTRDLEDCRVVLPSFVDHKHMGRFVTAEGKSACGRIISALAYYYPPITYAPLLHPLAACLLLYMNESDVYNSLSALVCSSKVTFLTQTNISHEVSWRTFLILARRHAGSGFSTLEKYGIDSKHVEGAFHDWLWWIMEGLPLPHLVRVLDCFLLEGWKVLVRVSLAIFQLYVKQISRDSGAAATLSTKGLSESIMIFCRNINIRPAKLMKTAFGIRALSKSEMMKVMSKTEQRLQKQGPGDSSSGMACNTHEDMTGLTTEEVPTASAQADVQMLSHTLNVKEGGKAHSPRQRALGDYPIRHLKSKCADVDELLTIWNWMPVRMTMYQPRLLYTTEEDGSSLTTFYKRVGNHDPTILLIRTTCDHVFGAYCSAPWDSRNRKDEYGNKQTYYGTGETFLFTLRPVPAKYQWVGITQQEKNSALKNVAHSSELFMHGDDEMITVGGGEGQGLSLDHELQFGKSETCQTFDNPPLCATKNFEIKVVEVYGIDVSQS